jgi:hypothetical protein
MLPKLNDKEKLVVDAYIKQLDERFEKQISRIIKENSELRKRNKILEDKLIRRNIV